MLDRDTGCRPICAEAPNSQRKLQQRCTSTVPCWPAGSHHAGSERAMPSVAAAGVAIVAAAAAAAAVGSLAVPSTSHCDAAPQGFAASAAAQQSTGATPREAAPAAAGLPLQGEQAPQRLAALRKPFPMTAEEVITPRNQLDTLPPTWRNPQRVQGEAMLTVIGKILHCTLQSNARGHPDSCVQGPKGALQAAGGLAGDVARLKRWLGAVGGDVAGIDIVASPAVGLQSVANPRNTPLHRMCTYCHHLAHPRVRHI